MGWGMWLLMLAGTVAFWGVILLGLRALLEVREEDGAAQPEQAMDSSREPARGHRTRVSAITTRR